MQKSGKKITGRMNKDGTLDGLQSYVEKIQNTKICPHIVESLAIDLEFDTNWMVELNEHYDRKNESSFKNTLIGHTHVVVGPAQCGKMGMVYWRKKHEQQQLNIKTILIDCIYHPSPYNFGCQLVEQLADILDKSTTKKTKKSSSSSGLNNIQNVDDFSQKMIVENLINLSVLDPHIKAKPLLKIVLIVRNADLLVLSKKQTMLYSLFEWMKSDIRSQVGLVLMTSQFTFLNSLQKRVKSRLNSTIIIIFDPTDEKKIKSMIQKRIRYSVNDAKQQKTRKNIEKLADIIDKSIIIQKFLKQEIKNCVQPITYYLQIFKLIFSIEFSQEKLIGLLNKQSQLLENQIVYRFHRVKPFVSKYARPDELKLQQMGYPQLIMMCYIRKMLLIVDKAKISFKQIKKQILAFKIQQHNEGGSFYYHDDQYMKALKSLSKIRVIEIYKNNNDFDNSEILCYLEPQQIKLAIQGRTDIPEYVKNLLN